MDNQVLSEGELAVRELFKVPYSDEALEYVERTADTFGAVNKRCVGELITTIRHQQARISGLKTERTKMRNMLAWIEDATDPEYALDGVKKTSPVYRHIKERYEQINIRARYGLGRATTQEAGNGEGL